MSKIVTKMFKLALVFPILFLVISSGAANLQAQVQDSLSVTWYVSYDGFYDYVHQGSGLSDVGKIILVLAILSTYVLYRRWQRSRQRVVHQ
jgi:hypothetical protein